MKLSVRVSDGKFTFELDHEGEDDLEAGTRRAITGLSFGAYCTYMAMMNDMEADAYDDETFAMFAEAVNIFLWETYENSKDEAPLEIKELDD